MDYSESVYEGLVFFCAEKTFRNLYRNYNWTLPVGSLNCGAMGRMKRMFKSQVESMVTCGLSKSYQKFNSADNIVGEAICNTDILSSSASSNMTNRENIAENSSSFCYSCSECGHRGTIEVRL